MISYLKRFDAAAYNPAQELVNEGMVRELRNNGFAVNVFTVNDPVTIKKLINQGVSSVITDFPDLTVIKTL